MRAGIVMVAALAPLIAAAQSAPGPDASDPKAAKPPAGYRSAFDGYRPYAEPDIARWREVNEEMGRLGGHVGHVPGSLPARGAAPQSAKPPAHAGHGERK